MPTDSQSSVPAWSLNANEGLSVHAGGLEIVKALEACEVEIRRIKLVMTPPFPTHCKF